MRIMTKPGIETDALSTKMGAYNAARKKENEERDVLRDKMDKYVIDHIEKYLAPELRGNEDAICYAREWFSEGVTLYEINTRLDVLQSEYIERMRLEILKEEAEQEELEMGEADKLEGFGPSKSVNQHEFDQMSAEDIYQMEQQKQREQMQNDLYYLHF